MVVKHFVLLALLAVAIARLVSGIVRRRARGSATGPLRLREACSAWVASLSEAERFGYLGLGIVALSYCAEPAVHYVGYLTDSPLIYAAMGGTATVLAIVWFAAGLRRVLNGSNRRQNVLVFLGLTVVVVYLLREAIGSFILVTVLLVMSGMKG